jgi:aminoglycoside phosphotransferase (APT) family kinase protein
MSPNMLRWVDEPEIQRLTLQIFGDRIPVDFERAGDGISTLVYRLSRGEETFYLRILPEVGDSFSPEAYVHTLLRRHGVHVPEVIYLEHRNDVLQRSVMVTTEVRGRSVDHRPMDEATVNILMEAGRDLAVINSIPVEGFGWIKRDRSAVDRLEAEQASNRAFLLEGLDHCLRVLGGTVLTPHKARRIRDLVSQHSVWLDVGQGSLAHGDFDVTHIYQENECYTGIIDFGEIRGSDPYYDLGHFRLHDREIAPYEALPSLLAGYRQVASLPPDYEQRFAFLSLLIGIHFLARGVQKLTAHELSEHTRLHARTSIERDLELLRG